MHHFQHHIRQPFVMSLLALAAAQAMAQQAAPKGEVQEIVVTANRVATSAQRTPVALSVYSGEALADAGVATVQALQGLDTSINLTTSSGAAYVAMRGVASTDVTETGDPSVSIARDGFFTNRSFGIGASFYDLERIEVLKGPQGTLFGRNSSGGLINIISQKPTKKAEGHVIADLGTSNTQNFEAVINRPLNDTFQLRVSAISRKHDGYRTITGVNQKGDDENTQSARVQLAAQPTTGLRALVSFQNDHINNVGDLPKNMPLAKVVPLGNAREFAGDAPSSNRLIGNRARWEVEYDRLPGNWVLNVQGGLDKQDWQHKLDATHHAAANPYPASRQFVQHESPTTWNHEVRVSSPQTTDLTAQFGYFRFTETNTVNSGLLNVKMGALPPGANDYSGQYGIRFNYALDTQSTGLFGQVGYKLSPTLKLNLGARTTSEKKVRTGDANLIIGALVSPFVPPFVTVNTPGDGKTDMKKPTYLVDLDWTPTADNFLYAKYSSGFKSGGFNSNGSSAPVPYGAETINAYELGTKNRLWDRKLQVNATLFMQDYKGYQASQTTDVLSGGGIYNVGSAKIKGLEGSIVAKISETTKFDASATYLQTKFGNGIVIRDAAGDNVDISGKRLPNAPKLVYTAGVEQIFQLGGGNVAAHLFGKHSTAYYYSVSNVADEFSPAYTTANLSLLYTPNEGNWTAQLYVDNLSDAVVVANARRNYVSHSNTVQFAPPRTAGVRVRYNF